MPPPLVWAGCLLVVTFVLDQWTKRRITAIHFASPTHVPAPMPPRLRYLAHRSPRFARRASHAVFAVLWLLALACGLTLHFSGVLFQTSWAAAGLGMALGGALGNLTDMIRLSHVVDFIDLGWWPVFNVADAGIVAGLAAALLG